MEYIKQANTIVVSDFMTAREAHKIAEEKKPLIDAALDEEEWTSIKNGILYAVERGICKCYAVSLRENTRNKIEEFGYEIVENIPDKNKELEFKYTIKW